MKIDNARPFQRSSRVQHQHRRPNRPKFAYYKKLGHHIEHCYKRKNTVAFYNTRQNHTRANINFFEDELVEDEAVEDELAEVESVEEEVVATTSYEVITTLDAASFSPFTSKDLIVKQGHLDHRAVNIMLDSGATCNVVKPGLLHRVMSEVTIQVTRFDGTNTIKKNVKKGVVNIAFDGYHFS